MEQDIAYHALKDSMENDACPICAHTEHTIRQAMRSVLYESMTDPKLRDTIKDARGFCRFHSEMFLQEGDPLSHAIVYGDALRGALLDVVSDEYKYYEDRQSCYFCDLSADTEQAFSNACYEALHEEAFFEKYRQSGLLCMVHLHAMEQRSEQEKNGEAFYEKLAQATVDKYQIMIRQLNEIQRKSDYRNLGEAWTEEEKTAWRRAVNVIHDRVGIDRRPRSKRPHFALFPHKR